MLSKGLMKNLAASFAAMLGRQARGAIFSKGVISSLAVSLAKMLGSSAPC
jgi:hypothetical protein